jgi:hypothetical protein
LASTEINDKSESTRKYMYGTFTFDIYF